MPVLGANVSGQKIGRGIYVPSGSLDVWRAARDAAATTRTEVVVFGDSTVYANSSTGPNYAWIQRLRQLIRADNPAKDGGLGFFQHFMMNSANTGGTSFVWTPEAGSPWAASGWTVHDSFSYTIPGIIESGTAGDTVTVTIPATHRAGASLRIWRPLYSGIGFGAGAEFTYSINGGAAVLVGSAGDLTGTSVASVVSGNSWSMACTTLTGINPGDVIVFTALGGIYEEQAIFYGGQALGIYDEGAGVLPAGTYYYKITKAGGGGETLPSSSVNITIAVNHAVHLRLSGSLPSGTWNIYRATSSGGPYLLVGTKTDATGAGGPGAILDYVDNNPTPGAQQPPTTATPVLNTFISKALFGLDLLNSTGIAFHNQGLPGALWTTFFDPADALHNISAATLMGLTSYTAGANSYADELKVGGISPRRPSLVMAQFGVNDVGGTENIAGCVDLFIEMCRNAGADPLVIIPTTYNRSQRLTGGGTMRRDIASVCMAAGAALVDFQQALGPIAQMVSNGYLIGDVHLSHAAYNHEAEWLWNNVLSAAALP